MQKERSTEKTCSSLWSTRCGENNRQEMQKAVECNSISLECPNRPKITLNRSSETLEGQVGHTNERSNSVEARLERQVLLGGRLGERPRMLSCALIRAQSRYLEGPKSTPRGLKIDSWRLQNRAKIAQGGEGAPQERPKSAQERPKSAQERPKSAKERPKSGQERPKSAPRAPKSAPRAPKSAPRAPKSTPRAPKSAPSAPFDCDL